jgi:hypothetical protein
LHGSCRTRRPLNYARSAFEWKLKKHCEERHVPVRYFRDSAKVTADSLWQAAKHKALENATPADRHALEAVFRRVEMFRNIISESTQSRRTSYG